jgi:hypothetical protein
LGILLYCDSFVSQICTFLWDRKQFLSYPILVSGISRLVVAFAPYFDITDEEFMAELGLHVLISSMCDSDIVMEGADHLQQAMIQRVRSVMLLDKWFLFSRPGQTNDHGTLARLYINVSTFAGD